MKRRLFLLGAVSVLASAGVAENPFLANESLDASNPFIAEYASVENPKVKKAIIEFYTRTNCPPCKAWKDNMLPKVVKSGWTVKTFQAASNMPSPYFVLWDQGKRYTHTGYMSVADMKKLLGRDQSEPQTIIVEESVIEWPVSQPQSCPSGNCPQNIRGYRPRWTFPRGLRRHLSGAPHYIDATGWTQDQMELAHDQHHDRMRAFGRRVRSRYA